FGKDIARHLAETDADLGFGVVEAFSGSDEEGHAVPAPVVHFEHGGGIGGGNGVGRGAFFFEVAEILLAAGGSGRVLGDDEVVEGEGCDGAEGFYLLVAYVGGVEGDGLLHGDECEHLEEVVLHYVADDAV